MRPILPSSRHTRFRGALALLAVLAIIGACAGEANPPTAPATSRPASASSSLTATDVRTIHGPVVFTRGSGAPATHSFELEGFAPEATIEIVNGDASGGRRVTSASVSVDGLEVVHPSQFGEKVGGISVPVILGNASTVSISLAGAPGDFLSVVVRGSLATRGSVGPAGGEVHLLGDQVTVAIPPGALGSTGSITAEAAPAPDAAPVPGTSIEMGPSGTTFAQPVDLTIAFDPSALPRWVRPAGLSMYWRNGDHWEPLPASRVDLASSRVTAQTTHFSTFALLPDAREFCPGDPSADADLQAAVQLLPAGGTLYVCDGQFTIDTVTLDKPLTLRSEHSGMATLRDADPAPVFQGGRPALWVTNSEGTVRIADLRFDVGGRAIVPTGHNRVQIDSVAFTGRDSTIAIGVHVIGGRETPSTGHVEIANSSFDHLAIGAFAIFDARVDVRTSLFRRFSTGSITHSSSFFPGIGSIGAAGIIEDNVFADCQVNGCLRTFARWAVIRRNRFELPDGVSRIGAIVLPRRPDLLGALPVIIEDNEILAARRPGDPAVASSYTAAAGILWQSAAPTAADTVRRNRITGAFAGMQISALSARVYATDNTVQDGVLGFIQPTPSPEVIIRRNDFVGLLGSFAGSAGGAYQCNWWGSAAGPTSPGVGLFLPWAGEPIAGRSVVACDPAAAPTTVRACPMPGGGLPTFPTILQAYGAVPVGGTVLVCDGTFAVNEISINTSVTITAEGPGMPTLDAGSNPRAITVANVVGGPVTISKLRFIGGTAGQLRMTAGAGTLTVRENEFHPNQTSPFGTLPSGSISAFVGGGSGNLSLTVTGNTFVGGDFGINLGAAPGQSISVTANHFASQVTWPLAVGTGGPAASVAISGNTFEDCAPSGCVFLAQPATVQGNTFTAHMSRRYFAYVQSQVPTTISTQPAIIDGNHFTALDLGNGSRAFASTYPVNNGVFVGAGSAIVSRNVITGAFFGISAASPQGTTATDNIITQTASPLANQQGTPDMTLLVANWNDVSDYVSALGNVTGFNLGTLNVRCNWWGAAAGPVGMPGSIPSTAFTPVASAPVAGQGHSGCTP